MTKMIYSDNEEEFRHEDIESALEIAWDSAVDTDQKIFSVYEGRLTDEYVDSESGCGLHQVVTSIKERFFKMIKDDEYFHFENFEEVFNT